MRPKETFFDVIIHIDQIKRYSNTYYYFKGNNTTFNTDVYGYLDTIGNISFYVLGEDGNPKPSPLCNSKDKDGNPLYSEYLDDYQAVIVTIDNTDILPPKIKEKYLQNNGKKHAFLLDLISKKWYN